MNRLTLPTIEGCPHTAQDVFLTGTMSQFADRADAVPEDFSTRQECKTSNKWMGGKAWDDVVSCTRQGDLSGVAKSDAFLSKFENLAPSRPAWAVVNDVVGAMPDVGAFLAGHPLAMRRRTRLAKETAPLTIAVDLVSSAGVTSSDLQKRGALILALVRALSISRPVELWAGGSALPYGKRGAFHVFFKIDTAPLDLARAAHVLTCTAVARALIYATISHEAGSKGGDLQWPYSDHTWSRANMRPILSRAFGQEDMLTIAAPHAEDELVDRPEAWFERMLTQYGGADHDA